MTLELTAQLRAKPPGGRSGRAPKRHRRSLCVNDHQFFWHFTSGRELDHRKFDK
jgi:hypothetical protein